jgi:hypothetical protein
VICCQNVGDRRIVRLALPYSSVYSSSMYSTLVF